MSNNFACDSGEVAIWTLGTVGPGQSVTVSLPPVVTNDATTVPDGSLIPWRASVTRSGLTASSRQLSLCIGASGCTNDGDGDSVGDHIDNRIVTSNTNQRDTNADGFGNRCDPDLNNDGAVNAVDLGLMRLQFFTSDPDADLNGDGAVNAADLGIMRVNFFRPAGPSAYR